MHPVASIRNLFLNGVDEAAAALIIDRLRASDADMAAVNLRVLGGAIGRVPAADTAFAHRNRRIMANVAALGFEPGRIRCSRRLGIRLRGRASGTATARPT